MFLPTKAHQKEITKGQYRLRLGNRVPKGAVNLAYTYIRPINSDENVLITDLSDTILENTQNDSAGYMEMYPDHSLMLRDDNNTFQLLTEDVLMTNVFKDKHPLYYAYTLAYRYYDKNGPDQYGIYQGNGISIVDQFNNPVTRPYQIYLTPDENNLHLYFVTIYTSFRDKESDNYRVVYNAIDMNDDGTSSVKLGFKEPLSLMMAFRKTKDIKNLLTNQRQPIYYQANGRRVGSSSLYVSTPRVQDTRIYEKFRYQVVLEMSDDKDSELFTTPWFVDSVLHEQDLLDQEKDSYINGYKQLTTDTAESILLRYTSSKQLEKWKNGIRRYFVRIDNPNVKESLRIDGSSPIFAKTDAVRPNNKLQIAKDNRVIRKPITLESKLHFFARPLYASEHETAYISFILDNSKSMSVNDEDRLIRLKTMENILEAAQDFYQYTMINGFYFNRTTHPIKLDFERANKGFIEYYDKHSDKDHDITNPEGALIESINFMNNNVVHSYVEDITSKTNHKYLMLITDGRFDNIGLVEKSLEDAKKDGIMVALVTFHNFVKLSTICAKYDAVCIDAQDPKTLIHFRNFFFDALARQSALQIKEPLVFSISPTENNKRIFQFNKDTFTFPTTILNDKKRFGIEIALEDEPKEIGIYLQDSAGNIRDTNLYNTNITRIESLHSFSSMYVMAYSKAWDTYFCPLYAVRFNDKQRIQVLPPREKDGTIPWHLRIRNGRFDRQFLDQNDTPTYHYSIPEYYRQHFLAKGHPYREVKNERPQILTENRLRLLHTPLHCLFDGEKITNMTLRINGNVIRVKEWHANDGTILIDGIVSRNDDISIDYEYEEYSYVYKGYFNEEENRFFHLDLNPSKGHYTTIRDQVDNQIKDVPSFVLLDKTIYIYIKPSSKIQIDSNGFVLPTTEIEDYTLYHTFEKIDTVNTILIAEVRVRPNSREENLEIIDTRTRGGGLKESITREIMREFEEESCFYWDIGHWDGEPYPENGVIALRLSKNVLKEYGGRFTKHEVEEKLHKYLGYGILPIIEYIDEADALLQIPENLVVEVIDVRENDELAILQPTFALRLEETDGTTN